MRSKQRYWNITYLFARLALIVATIWYSVHASAQLKVLPGSASRGEQLLVEKVSFNLLYVLALDGLGLDEPDLLIGSWAPPFAWHTATFGTTYTFAMNAIASGLQFAVGLVSGWLLARLFRNDSRSFVLLFSFTVLLSWVGYSAGLGDDAIGASLPWSLYFWMNSLVQTACVLLGAWAANAEVFRGVPKANR